MTNDAKDRLIKRVIIVNDHAYPQGGSSVIALQHRGLLKREGLDVLFFVGQMHSKRRKAAGWGKDHHGAIYSTEQEDLLGDPNKFRSAFNGLWNLTAAKRFSDILNKYQPEDTVVLVHGWTKILSSSVLRVAHVRGFKIIAVLHDYASGCPNGAYHDFRLGRHCDLTPLSLGCVRADCDRTSYAQKLWRVVRQWVQTYLAGVPEIFATTVFVSAYQSRIMKTWFDNSLRTTILPNPISEPPIDLKGNPASNKEFVFIGRLSPEKGADIFAEAAKIADVRATAVGDGPERERLSRLNPMLNITGWLDRESVWAELLRARALVFPSILHETFGLTVYEAAALGVPSIVSSECVATEFVKHEVNGLVFQSGDVNSLVNCLQQLANDDDLVRKLGQMAKFSYAEYIQSQPAYQHRLIDLLEG